MYPLHRETPLNVRIGRYNSGASITTGVLDSSFHPFTAMASPAIPSDPASRRPLPKGGFIRDHGDELDIVSAVLPLNALQASDLQDA